MAESNLHHPKGLVARAVERARKKESKKNCRSKALNATTPEELELADEVLDLLENQKEAKNATTTLPPVLQRFRNLRPYIDRIVTSTSADWRKLHGKSPS